MLWNVLVKGLFGRHKLDGSHPDVSKNYQNRVISVKHNLNYSLRLLYVSRHTKYIYSSLLSPTYELLYIISRCSMLYQ